MILPNNRWIQRIIALFCAGALGILTDRVTHSPLWGFGVGVISAGILIIWVSQPLMIDRHIKIDRDAGETLRTVLMSLFFFIVCAIAAVLIISQ